MEKKKLTPEELQLIQDMQIQYNKIILEIGSVEVQMVELNQSKETLLGLIKEINVKEKEMVTNLEQKYGKGSIDINTGEISPIV